MIEDRTRRLLDVRLARDQATERLPSVAAGLARDGELVWTGGRGRADSRTPDANTQYRAGSITKTFVAVTVMRLRDAGQLSLSDPIEDHLSLTEIGGSVPVAQMTIGQLLSHSAGLRAETAGPWWERTAGGPLTDLAASSLGSDAVRFRRGQRFHYSNVGYALLGAMVAAKSGKPWHEVVAEDVLAPLNMTRTTTRPQRPYARGYAVHPYADVLLDEPEHDAESMAPAGQLWTTVTDLASFARFLAGEDAGILAQDTLAEMREPIVVSDGAGQAWTRAYGLGLELWNSASGIHYYGHSGSMPGFVAMLRITDAPGADTVLLASNSTTGFGQSLSSDLLTILADQEPYLPAEWHPAEVKDGLLEVLGAWFWGPAPHTLRLSGDELQLTRDGIGGHGMRFKRADDGNWRGLDGYMAGEPLKVIAGPDGRPQALDIGSFIYTRTPYDPDAAVPGGVEPANWHAPSQT
jgi:CubicO group peptidase (beta-lactamase class C family)